MAIRIGGRRRHASRIVRPGTSRHNGWVAAEDTMLSQHSYDRRRVIGGLAAAALAAGLRPASAQDNRLVIPTYGGRYERFWREVLIPPFEQRTGVHTVLDIGLGANFAA